MGKIKIQEQNDKFESTKPNAKQYSQNQISNLHQTHHPMTDQSAYQPIFTYTDTPLHSQQPQHQSVASHQNQLLHQYIQCLEKQNHTKNVQRLTLYSELEKLQQNLHFLHSELDQAKALMQSEDLNQLKARIRDLEEEVTILKYEQQHLFEENLSLITSCEQTSQKLMDAERGKKELKSHKEELERFRMALEKITQNLQQIEIERFALAQANLGLMEENSYLKNLLKGKEQTSHEERDEQKSQVNSIQLRVLKANEEQAARSGQATSISNYLMSSSFEKISEYEQQYEESNEHSVSRNNSASRANDGSCDNSETGVRSGEGSGEKSLHEWDEGEGKDCSGNEEESKQRELRQVMGKSYERKDENNQSSYLIFDERSGESLSLSFEVHELKDQNHSLSYGRSTNTVKNGQNTGENDGDGCQEEDQGYKHNDESSSDVIQQLNEEPSSLRLNLVDETKQRLNNYHEGNEVDSLKREVETLKREVALLRQQLGQSQTKRREGLKMIGEKDKKMRETEKKMREMEKTMREMEMTEQKSIEQMQRKIQQLLSNYQSILQYTQQLQQDNVQLYHTNEQLQTQKQHSSHQIQSLQQHLQSLHNHSQSVLSQNQEQPLAYDAERLLHERHELEVQNQQLYRQREQLFSDREEIIVQRDRLFCDNDRLVRQNCQLDSENRHLAQENLELALENQQLKASLADIRRFYPDSRHHSKPHSHRPPSHYSAQSSPNLHLLDLTHDKENHINAHNHRSPSPSHKQFFRNHLNNNSNHLNSSNNHLNSSNSHLNNNNSMSFRSQLNKQLSFRSQLNKQSSKGTESLNKSSNTLIKQQKQTKDSRECLKQKLQQRIDCIQQQNICLLESLQHY